jgi:hypothetical protein
LSVENTLLERLAEHLEHMAAKFGEFIQKQHAVVGQGHVTHIGTWQPPISPASEMVWSGARHERVVTKAVRSPVWGVRGSSIRIWTHYFANI